MVADGARLIRFASTIALAIGLTACSPGSSERLDPLSSESTPSSAVAAPGSGVDEAAIVERAHSWGEKLQIFKMRCMRDAGWDEHLQPDFSLTGTVPPEQREAYQKDSDACEASYEAEFPKPVLTAADYRARYADELKTMACLEKQGYPPVAAPISQQQFVSQMLAGGTASWIAYDAVGNVGPDEWDRLERVCPQPGDL